MSAKAHTEYVAPRTSEKSRIRQNSIRLLFDTLSHFCALDPVSAHYVKHDLTGGNEVVCDDATVALPPDRFGAHYCTGTLMPETAQPIEASTELFRHRIVGVIMKTLVLPKRIHCGRDIALVSTAAAESCEVLIPDLKIRQRCRKYLAIELGISP